VKPEKRTFPISDGESKSSELHDLRLSQCRLGLNGSPIHSSELTLVKRHVPSGQHAHVFRGARRSFGGTHINSVKFSSFDNAPRQPGTTIFPNVYRLCKSPKAAKQQPQRQPQVRPAMIRQNKYHPSKVIIRPGVLQISL
jgi:hypothetical protein